MTFLVALFVIELLLFVYVCVFLDSKIDIQLSKIWVKHSMLYKTDPQVLASNYQHRVKKLSVDIQVEFLSICRV